MDCLSFNLDHYSCCLISAEAPENGGGDLLLSNEFLRDSMGMFAVPFRASETISRTFPQKHLNIVDPLRENNNLGRSVSKGSCSVSVVGGLLPLAFSHYLCFTCVIEVICLLFIRLK